MRTDADRSRTAEESQRQDGVDPPGRTTRLFILDEPTTGLHFEDIRLLLAVLQRLVEQGDSLVVIEHNLDVLKCADWLIDLGPEAEMEGGRVVAAGTPETIAATPASHTGKFLAPETRAAQINGARCAKPRTATATAARPSVVSTPCRRRSRFAARAITT